MKRVKTVLSFFVMLIIMMSLLAQGASAAKQISVAFWDHGEAGRASMESVIRAFNRSQSEYVAVSDPIPGAIWAVLLARAAGGNPPDLCWFMPGNIDDFVEQNMLMDLTPYIKRDNYSLDDFFPMFIESFTIGGKIYAIPSDGNVSLVGYNKDMFDAAGVEYPSEDWNWDDMLALARKLTIRDSAGRAKQWGFNGFFGFFVNGGSFLKITWSNGGELFNKKEYPTACLATSKEVVDAITFVRDLRFKYKVEVMPGEPAGLDSSDNFYTGQAAMCFVSEDAEYNINRLGSNFNFGFQLVPKGSKTRVPSAGAVGYSIFKGSKHPDGGWEFIKFLISDEGQAAINAPIGGKVYFSVRKSLMEKIVAENMRRGRDLTPVLKTMALGRAYEYKMKPGIDWATPFGEAMDRIYSGQTDVMPAMKQVKPVIDAMLRKAHR